MAAEQILVIPSAYRKPVDGERALGGLIGPVELNVGILRSNLTHFMEAINDLLANLPAAGAFQLEEIELTVEVSAEGNIQLIGGAKAGITGGLLLKLKRKHSC